THWGVLNASSSQMVNVASAAQNRVQWVAGRRAATRSSRSTIGRKVMKGMPKNRMPKRSRIPMITDWGVERATLDSLTPALEERENGPSSLDHLCGSLPNNHRLNTNQCQFGSGFPLPELSVKIIR